MCVCVDLYLSSLQLRLQVTNVGFAGVFLVARDLSKMWTSVWSFHRAIRSGQVGIDSMVLPQGIAKQ